MKEEQETKYIIRTYMIISIVAFIYLIYSGISFALAYDDGDTVTQLQLDSIDIEQLTWRTINCQKDRVRLKEGEVWLDYSCQSLTPIVQGESYQVVRINYAYSFSLIDARVWFLDYGLQGAIAVVRQEAKENVYWTIQQIKGTIKSYQTPDIEEQAGSWFDDWTPFE